VDELCLSDFGVSRIVGEESQASTSVGTLAYKAPEGIQNFLSSKLKIKVNPHLKYDPFAADIWSLGVLISELAVGQPIPFPQLPEEKKKEKGDYSKLLKLAEQCCKSDPKARPSASQLLKSL
jgi:serine/threonine protein kinase